MAMTVAIPVNPRRALLGVFALMLVLSLVCSASIQYGHADVPIVLTADEIQPLRVGDAAPRFTVESVEGEAFNFDPRALDRPVILVAFRGGWCPFCNMHLSELRHVVPEIDGMGVDVLFLSGDRADLLYSSLDDETRAEIDGLGYRILSDAKANAAVALGIAFRASDSTIRRRHEKGQDIEASSMALHGVLPVPSVFAIDSTGTIRFAYTNADYKIRLPADELQEVAAAIVGN
jgi:peroxiredoxin